MTLTRSPGFIEDTPDTLGTFHYLAASEDQIVYGVLTVSGDSYVDADGATWDIDEATVSYVNARVAGTIFEYD